ncbi:hypothetical protein EI555_000172, partial [Monodon monoceros]
CLRKFFGTKPVEKVHQSVYDIATVVLWLRTPKETLEIGNLRAFAMEFDKHNISCISPMPEPWVLMDVAESPDWNPRSPEDEEVEQQGLSDNDILRERSGWGRGRASDVEDKENIAPGLSQEEEESRSDEEDRDSEAQEPSGGPARPPQAEGDLGKEDCTSDLRDEASSVTRDLDKHELDYDEEKAGPEDDEERREGAPGEEGKAGVRGMEDRDPVEAANEKRKEDNDGEIDDGEIDDDDLEEGEVKDPSDRKVRARLTCRFFMKDVVTPLSTSPSPISNSIPFRVQVKGQNAAHIHGKVDFDAP